MSIWSTSCRCLLPLWPLAPSRLSLRRGAGGVRLAAQVREDPGGYFFPASAGEKALALASALPHHGET